MLLYEYCAQFYPIYLNEISMAWIVAGIPFTREPGGKLESWNGELPKDVTLLYGKLEDVNRLYRLPDIEGDYWFGFDRRRSPSKPLFVVRG